MEFHYPQPLVTGTLQRRYKRFLADITLDTGETVVAHCANTGSMTGCATPGAQVTLSRSDNPKRKLAYTWQSIQHGDTWIGINTGLANTVVHRAIEQKSIPELSGYPTIRREVRLGEKSRLDFLLEAPERALCYVEVKSVTLAEEHVALFPDAVTTRGLKHITELMGAVAAGARGVMLYLVQRTDCDRFAPADAIDPAYGAALREAAACGVEVLAYEARVNRIGIQITRRLPVELESHSGDTPEP